MDDKETKARREFIFVIFKNEDSVDSCCAETYHCVSGTGVEVKKAIPREQDKRSRGSRGRSGDSRGYGSPRGECASITCCFYVVWCRIW